MPASSQEGDRGVMMRPRLEQEPVTVTGSSADLALAILNGLDISSLPALRHLSTVVSTMVQIPWAPAGLEQTTPEWPQQASEAMAFLLGSREGKRYRDWDSVLKQRPEFRLDSPDTTTPRGLWTARMHNSTVGRVLDELVAARAAGSRQPNAMNEILRDIAPRQGVLPVPEPVRGSPGVGETLPEAGE